MATQIGSQSEARALAAPVPGVVLVFSSTAPQLRAIPLRPDVPVVLGREDAGGSALPDGEVSGQHCEVVFDGHGFVVRDLKSRNGTWVNGVQLIDPAKSERAQFGGVLRMAKTVLLFCEDVRRFQAATVTTGDRVIGPSYRAALDEIAMGARKGAIVLIIGESGCGKEYASQVFHEAVGRSGPFLVLNCSTVRGTVALGALFGTVKGSYTDARDSKGLFREASGGVLFLDELGELDLEVQPMLLRAVENQEVTAVGGTAPVSVNVRLVCATNRDLQVRVDEGQFRADLYYRLNKCMVRLPPLRERKEEIPWLVQHAIGSLTAHPRLLEVVLGLPWPGNVRELIAEMENAADRARAEGVKVVRDHHLGPRAGRPTGTHPALAVAAPRAMDQTLPATPRAIAEAGADSRDKFVAAMTREQLVTALETNAWNVAGTAKELGCHRTTLVRAMEKLDIVRPTASS
jgi:transcriptional regulator with GAF, ATPase, and Fis domain